MMIRLRLTLLYSGILIATLFVFGSAVYGVLYRTLRLQADNQLTDTLNSIEPEIRSTLNKQGEIDYTPPLSDRDNFQAAGVFVQFWLPEYEYPILLSPNFGHYYTSLDHRSLTADHEVFTTVWIHDTPMRVATRPLEIEGQIVGHLQAAISLQTIDDATTKLSIILLVGGGLAVLSSFILGNWLASRALRPISRITETAQAIVAADDLNRRVPDDGPQDELGSLVTTINQMLERIGKLFHTQRRFTADISHELRTPLTAIQGHVELIERFGHDASSIAAIKAEVNRMIALVGDLLLLAQADTGRYTLNHGPVELSTLMLETYNRAQVLNQRGVKLILGEVDHLVVEGDAERLKQLLSNLIVNAFKYTEPDGTVTLTLEHVDRWAEIKVADTGIGIPAEHLPHIFTRFYRVDEARARSAGGSGLGLSIALWIAEAHHGTLTVESEVGKGTTFTLRLPLNHQGDHK